MRGLPQLGEYESVRLIASGGMGVVLEVIDRRTGVSYAGKVIHKAENATARERFRREAELLARCDRHPGIVKVHTTGETSTGAPYMILDLVRGESLEALLVREQKLDPHRAARIGRDVARALGFAHEQGIHHRDVKPANILLDESGEPHLTDFGLATARDVERLTVSGTFVGTPRYISPEQAIGNETSPASDVFSLGCVLYHALAGRSPIVGDSLVGVLAELSSGSPLEPIENEAPGVPGALAAIVTRALAKNPHERQADGSELAAELDAFLEGKALPRARGLAERRALFVLAGMVLLAAVLASTTAVLAHGRTQRAQEALAAARDELARARAALARAASGDLARARDHARRAASARDLAASSGADRDETFDRALASVEAEWALAQARDSLARGDARAALAAIDASTGAPEALALQGHLVRAHALHALGRLEDALRELDGGTGAEALETRGDVLVALDRPGEAVVAYCRAITLVTGKDARRVRAKRGGAAAQAGDAVTAGSDLAALLGEPVSLPSNAAAVALVGSIAPALYVRALAADDAAFRERDLDAAWRLGAPPASLAKTVARVWIAQAAVETEQIVKQAFMASSLFSEPRLKPLEAILARAARARAIDPAADLRPVDDALVSLHPCLINTPTNNRLPEARFMARLVAILPDSPWLHYLFATAARSEETGLIPEAMAALDRAVDLSSDPGPDDVVARAFANDVAHAMESLQLPVDLERMRRVVRRADCASSWLVLASTLRSRGDRDEEALDCYARAATATSTVGGSLDEESLPLGRVVVLDHMGRFEEALAELRELDRRRGSVHLTMLARFLRRAERWDEILSLVDVSSCEKSPIAPTVVLALSKKGRVDEARALVGRIGLPSGGATALSNLVLVGERERAVSALFSEGKTEEAVALAREVLRQTDVVEARRLLAVTLNRCGRPEEVLGIVPDPEADPLTLVERGLALAKLGEREAAREIAARMRRRGSGYEARALEVALK